MKSVGEMKPMMNSKEEVLIVGRSSQPHSSYMAGTQLGA